MTGKIFAVAVAFCLSVSACDYANPFAKHDDKNSGDIEEFRMGIISLNKYYDTHSFRPVEMDSINSNFIFSTIIDYKFNNDLAENITYSENGMECVVKLRKDVFFHDGSKLTPEDVIYSINEHKKNTSANNLINTGFLKSLHLTAENMGEGKLFFKLNTPGSLKHNLCNSPIVSERYEEMHKKKPPSEYIPNGTGPMRFANYDRSKGVLKLERFDKYFAGVPKIKKTALKFYPSLDSLEMALLKDEIDYSYLQGTLDKHLKSSPKFVWFEYPSTHCSSVIFNTFSPKLSDARVRKALSLLIDRDTIINDPYGLAGMATPTSVAFSRSYPETKPVSEKPDPARAMELFREAGYTRNNGRMMRDGKRLDLTIIFSVANLGGDVHLVRLLAAMWERAGINITLREVEGEIPAITENDEVILSRLADRFMLSDNVILFNSNAPEGGVIFPDRELEKLFLETSMESRESVLLEKKSLIQQRIKDLSPIVLLYYKSDWMVLGGKFAKNAHVVNLIAKDPAVLGYLVRSVR
jgi:ABC-type transport system substrate-binding protein